MPARQLHIALRVEKDILKLPKFVQKRTLLALEKIKTNPVGGIKLHGQLQDYYKYRIGDYRIVYEFISGESKVEVVRVEHRQGVYR
jgi:mRNA interferase RelE/StbE